MNIPHIHSYKYNLKETEQNQCQLKMKEIQKTNIYIGIYFILLWRKNINDLPYYMSVYNMQYTYVYKIYILSKFSKK